VAIRVNLKKATRCERIEAQSQRPKPSINGAWRRGCQASNGRVRARPEFALNYLLMAERVRPCESTMQPSAMHVHAVQRPGCSFRPENRLPLSSQISRPSCRLGTTVEIKCSSIGGLK
jgi:hypothetical protein